jgi:hypothetical protein
MRMPNAHEGSLDLAFIDATAEHASPVRLASEWIVRIDTHFLGGRRHFSNWEIADIGILIQFRKAGKLLRTKVALLQSKRLYPREQPFEEDDLSDYGLGFIRLFKGDTTPAQVTTPRTLSFSDESRYQALRVGDGQYNAVAAYEERHQIPVYYLLYHPSRIPHAVTVPLIETLDANGSNDIGCRIVPAQDLRAVLSGCAPHHAPSYAELKALRPIPQVGTSSAGGWRLEEFVADLAITCKAGYIAKDAHDSGLTTVFSRRSGPIGAAIAVTFDAPSDP